MQILNIHEHIFTPFGDNKVTMTIRGGFREESRDIDIENLTVPELINLLQTVYKAGIEDLKRNIARAFQQEMR